MSGMTVEQRLRRAIARMMPPQPAPVFAGGGFREVQPGAATVRAVLESLLREIDACSRCGKGGRCDCPKTQDQIRRRAEYLKQYGVNYRKQAMGTKQ